MKSYLMNPGFWVAVVLVAIVVNFVWNKFTSKGKLV